MTPSLAAVRDALPFLLGGALNTGLIVLGAMTLGLLLGVPAAVGLVYGPRWLRRLLGVYLWFFRGVPVLTLLFLFHFGLLPFLGEHLPLADTFSGLFERLDPAFVLKSQALLTAALVLGLTTGAYQANIFKGAILALPKGQFRAASALGMGDADAIRTVILPQALRLALPAWSNEYSIVLKDSALAFVIGAPEIMARAQFVASRTYQHLPLFLAAGLLYFLLTWAGVTLLRALERRVRIPGYAGETGAKLP